MLKKAAIVYALILAYCASAAAIDVGVVVEYPDGGMFSKCLAAGEEDDGYAVLEDTGLRLNWSVSELYGHGICAIEDVGCPQDNCWCTDKYWGFYVKHFGDDAWIYSPVGFDGGTGCQEHYCAKDGDLLGFAYGVYGTKPSEKTFEEICGRKAKEEVGREEPENGLGLPIIASVLVLAAVSCAIAYLRYSRKKT